METMEVTASYLRKEFAICANHAIYGGKAIVVVRNGDPEAVLLSYAEYKKLKEGKDKPSPL